MLPQGVELEKWAVIACDQFTSDREYWQRVQTLVADSPSALYLILPEAELGSVQESEKVTSINNAMLRYLEEGLFRLYPNCYIYVERTLLDGSVRPGLLGVVDLEAYDYSAGAVSAAVVAPSLLTPSAFGAASAFSASIFCLSDSSKSSTPSPA